LPRAPWEKTTDPRQRRGTTKRALQGAETVVCALSAYRSALCALPLTSILFLARSGGGGGFKKKGTFGRGNVRKRVEDEDDGEEAPAGAVTPAERKKKTLALGGTTARDDKVLTSFFIVCQKFAQNSQTLSIRPRPHILPGQASSVQL
jgi:hypothetical protein